MRLSKDWQRNDLFNDYRLNLAVQVNLKPLDVDAMHGSQQTREYILKQMIADAQAQVEALILMSFQDMT